MPGCSSTVTYERTEESPLRVTFEHNVNGPDDFVEEQKEEKKKKKEEEKTKRQEKRKADVQIRHTLSVYFSKRFRNEVPHFWCLV
jgi:hypothetical protein